MFDKATLNIIQRQTYFIVGYFSFLKCLISTDNTYLTSGTCFPHLLQYLPEEQMTDGYDLYLLVMMDCMLQALLMISKCVNYSLTCLLLSFKDFLSSFYLMKTFSRLKKKKAFLPLGFDCLSRQDLGRCCVLKNIAWVMSL